MLPLIAALFVNAAVGLLIGWSGIAGFLLPMFYIAFLNLPAPEALTLSFTAFAVSGAIGAFNYGKAGNLPLKTGVVLSAGSFLGAIPGILINNSIPDRQVKLLLYLVVLLSGLSILYRELKRPKKRPSDELGSLPGMGHAADKRPLFENRRFLFLMGFCTALLCALSGAGGPILVMPLLIMSGLEIRQAVGTALLGSVFIALPSVAGYGLQSSWQTLFPLLPVTAAAHGIGVLIGSRTYQMIGQRTLKLAVALFSIGISIYMFQTLPG